MNPARPDHPSTIPPSEGAAASVPPTLHAYSHLPTYKKRLPHWRASNATYFVTWRLHPSQMALSHQERALLVPALVHFEGKRYRLHAFVIMDDHIHVMLESAKQWPLETIVHSWKSYTANQLQRAHGRHGRLWQKDYFDRIIRDEKDFLTVWAYVVGNPFKRWPALEWYPWVGVCRVGGTEAAAPSAFGPERHGEEKISLGWERASL